jgi:hypothetical protein
MNRLILLDAGPLGLVSHPKTALQAEACRDWVREREAQGDFIIVPEIADYEVRRELLRARKSAGIARLDIVKSQLSYLPLTTQAMLRAAEFWAMARQTGQPTAHDHALDGDVILAAQAALLLDVGNHVVIATVNLKHFSLFVPADLWQNI